MHFVANGVCIHLIERIKVLGEVKDTLQNIIMKLNIIRRHNYLYPHTWFLALLVWFCVGIFGWLDCRAEPGVSIPYAQRMQFIERAGISQIRLHLSRSSRAKVFSLAQPYRLVVDLPRIDFTAIQAARPGVNSLLKGFRAGLISSNRSRLVFDVKGPFKIVDVRKERAVAGGRIIVLDVGIVSEAAFRPHGVAPRLLPSASIESLKSAKTSTEKSKFVIVIDPGHGGLDPGAIGANQTMEKNIALAVALRLVRVLSKKHHYSVFLTRNKDVFVSLNDRVALARAHDADLFISLHADAVALKRTAKKIRGATFYTLSHIASDDRAKLLAEKENKSDALAGLPIAPSAARGSIEAILFDLMRRETADFSYRLREHLIRRMRRSIRLSRSPRRSANFRVLWQPETPSVLIELGYMSNQQDVYELTRAKWQSRAAIAIAQAIEAYFEELKR